MDGTRARTAPETLAGVRPVEPASPPPDPATSRWVDAVLAVVPIVATVVIVAASPTTSPDDAAPAIFELLGLGLWLTLIGGVVAAITGSTTISRWALGSVVILAAGQVACGVGGHGSFGDAWFAVQSVAVVTCAAVVTPLALTRRQ
jgi:peptidoglycan/LPS O-acetylase OafA/YrhL